MTNYLVRASSMDGIRTTIASLGGDADEIFRRQGMLEQDFDPQSWFSYYRFLLLLEDALQGWSVLPKWVNEHWQLYLGVILVLVVLFARRGLAGLLPGKERNG